MSARWILAASAAALIGLAAALGGADAFGRLALALGLPGPARALFQTPEWQATAAYRAAEFEAAAAGFARAPGADFNTGVALARAGRYAAALEAFDRVLAGDPADAEAKANFELIERIYAGTAISMDAAFAIIHRDDEGPVVEGPMGLGQVRAAGTGDEVHDGGTSLGMAELQSTGRIGVRQQFDDKFMIANDRWLRTLADVPGEYLGARIAEERKRRAALGLAPPVPEDPR